MSPTAAVAQYLFKGRLCLMDKFSYCRVSCLSIFPRDKYIVLQSIYMSLFSLLCICDAQYLNILDELGCIHIASYTYCTLICFILFISQLSPFPQLHCCTSLQSVSLTSISSYLSLILLFQLFIIYNSHIRDIT